MTNMTRAELAQWQYTGWEKIFDSIPCTIKDVHFSGLRTGGEVRGVKIDHKWTYITWSYKNGHGLVFPDSRCNWKTGDLARYDGI